MSAGHEFECFEFRVRPERSRAGLERRRLSVVCRAGTLGGVAVGGLTGDGMAR